MKIYISADIEGICGVTHPKQTIVEGLEYQRARKLLTGEINAGVEGALTGGAGEIVVNDAHYSMRNLAREDLHPGAGLITGFPKTLLMMEGIDESYQGAVFIGYHAMSGSRGILAHTISSRIFSSIKINGREFGETGLSAALAGHFNVPVLVVSGDDVLREETFALLPETEYVQVKRVISSRAAECISTTEAQNMIREKVGAAVSNIKKYRPFKVRAPINLEVTLLYPVMADVAEAIPGVGRASACTVVCKAEDFVEATRTLFSIMAATSILLTDAYI